MTDLLIVAGVVAALVAVILAAGFAVDALVRWLSGSRVAAFLILAALTLAATFVAAAESAYHTGTATP